MDYAEWLKDYEQIDPVTGKRKKDFADLVAKVGIDIAKVGISAVLGSLGMALATYFALVAFSLTLPLFIIAIGAILVSVAVGYGLDLLDKKAGITDQVTNSFRSSAEYLKSKLPSEYTTYPTSFDDGYWTGA